MEENLLKLSSLSKSKFEQSLKKIRIDSLKEIKSYLDDKYYNTGEKCEFSDNQYDILKDYIIKNDKDYENIIGSKIREDNNRVTLPLYLGSLDKIKLEDTNKLENWLEKYKHEEYIISDKLDGVSALFISKEGNMKLYTRGDGVIGADITHLIKYIIDIPKKLKEDIAIRGELIIKKKVFENKYSDKFANARNMISGLVNSKSLREGVKDINFIGYEIIDIQKNIELKKQIKPYEQFKKIKELGFTLVRNDKINNIEMDLLSEILLKNLSKNEYEIDGIIIQSNQEYIRNIKDNPKYQFAFKMTLDSNLIEAEVEEVEWNISKHKIIKPRIRIKPVNLNGVKITYATGFNAKYIFTKSIGTGSIVKITRSGDVIPFIVEVIKCSDKPDMPIIEYTWGENNVDIIVKDDIDNVSDIKMISSFFQNMDIKCVSEATVERMYNYGLTNLKKIFEASISDFEKIDRFGPKLAEKIYNNIHNGLKNISIDILLGSSCIFGYGMGKRKIKVLMDEIPDLFTIYKKLTKEELLNKINKLEGFSNITSQKILDNIEKADKFLKDIDKFVTYKNIKSDTINSDNKLKDKTYLFSGFRDKELEAKIISNGGKIVTSISKNLSFLIIKEYLEKDSLKVQKAKDLNIPILLKDEFKI
jgi:DNA ligase (NAD+)